MPEIKLTFLTFPSRMVPQLKFEGTAPEAPWELGTLTLDFGSGHILQRMEQNSGDVTA